MQYQYITLGQTAEHWSDRNIPGKSIHNTSGDLIGWIHINGTFQIYKLVAIPFSALIEITLACSKCIDENPIH